MKHAIFNRLALAPLALLLAGGAALQAEDGSMRFGAGLQIANPAGKLSDGAEMGFGLALFGEMPLADRHALRGRVDYNLFGEKSDTKTSASAMTVFADYIFRFDSHDKGLYAFGGLGMVNGSLKEDSESVSGSGFGISAGLGYNFSRNLGAEAQYVTASGLDFDGYKMDFNWMQVSFKYRF